MEISHPSVAVWEKAFPGKAVDIVSFLEPLYDKRVTLKPLMTNIEEVAERAFFWCELKGVRVFRRKEIASLRKSLNHSLGTILAHEFHLSMSEDFFMRIIEFMTSFVYLNTPGLMVSVHLDLGFVDTIAYGTAYAITNGRKGAAKFRPLLDFWLAGNYPIGFDEDGNLLVLVAD